MADAFDDVRLPIHIERGAKGGPGFNTTIKDLASGREKRNQNWSRSRARWDIGYAIDDIEGIRPVLAFFYARRARARGFRFRDWTDFELPRQAIGVGDAEHRVFQIFKRYQDAGGTFDRPLTRPVRGTIRVWVNGTEQELLPDGWESDAPAPTPLAFAAAASGTVYADLDRASIAVVTGTPAAPLLAADGLTLTLEDQGSKQGMVGALGSQSISDGKRMFEVLLNPPPANTFGRDDVIVGIHSPSWGGWASSTPGGLIAVYGTAIFDESGAVRAADPTFDPNTPFLCLGFAIDHEAGQVHIHADGVRVATVPCVPGRSYTPTVALTASAAGGGPRSRVTFNFGASPYRHPIEGFKAVYTGDDPGTPGGGDPDPDPVRPMPPAGTIAVDADTGQVLFGTAPASGAVIEAACEFDIPARFDIDNLEQQLQAGEYSSIPSIPILEIKE